MKTVILFLILAFFNGELQAQKQQSNKVDMTNSLSGLKNIDSPDQVLNFSMDIDFCLWYNSNGFIIDYQGKTQPEMNELNTVQSSIGDYLSIDLLLYGSFNISDWPSLHNDSMNIYLADQNSGAIVLFYSMPRARVLYEREKVNKTQPNN